MNDSNSTSNSDGIGGSTKSISDDGKIALTILIITVARYRIYVYFSLFIIIIIIIKCNSIFSV